MNDLQELLTFLRKLPEVALLEAGVKELAASSWDEDESETMNYECFLRANDLRHKLESLGINAESEWGENNSWSVRLCTNDCSVFGSILPGPVIADCRITVGSYFSE